MNNDESSTWYPTPICENDDGELCCDSYYMKCPINSGHVVPKRRMKKHLRKIHNFHTFEPGLYGKDFDNHIFWYWSSNYVDYQ